MLGHTGPMMMYLVLYIVSSCHSCWLCNKPHSMKTFKATPGFLRWTPSFCPPSKDATLSHLSIGSLLGLIPHPRPNRGQARLMRLGLTGMSVKSLSFGQGWSRVINQTGIADARGSMRPGDADLSTVALILSGSGFLCGCVCGGVCVC